MRNQALGTGLRARGSGEDTAVGTWGSRCDIGKGTDVGYPASEGKRAERARQDCEDPRSLEERKVGRERGVKTRSPKRVKAEL